MLQGLLARVNSIHVCVNISIVKDRISSIASYGLTEELLEEYPGSQEIKSQMQLTMDYGKQLSIPQVRTGAYRPSTHQRLKNIHMEESSPDQLFWAGSKRETNRKGNPRDGGGGQDERHRGLGGILQDSYAGLKSLVANAFPAIHCGEGRSFRRNRRQLRSTLEPPPDPSSNIEEVNPTQARNGSSSHVAPDQYPDPPVPENRESDTPSPTRSVPKGPEGTETDSGPHTDVPVEPDIPRPG
ncbi:hypothetical protein OS493_018461 [Desmophyllum pertusum]|uniref:Uncharacterized protein n=1 Tax=Desmophyllum pertusum TaxID=174260 RepID=A0A9X0A0V4_9CNID|nr:hypothetical protein OS493_018461 [Desmophyllum pertusum]